PNATTFIYPGELFPTRVRGTGAGLSAAAGKLGAVLAQVVFAPMAKRGATVNNPEPWLDRLMQVFALFMLCGLLTSLLLPETKRKTLEELAGEKEPIYQLKFMSTFFRSPDQKGAQRNRRDHFSLRRFGGLMSGRGAEHNDMTDLTDEETGQSPKVYDYDNIMPGGNARQRNTFQERWPE
ncbi:hypothetical protein LTS18_004543, partial [Coniosporium uncinatum]